MEFEELSSHAETKEKSKEHKGFIKGVLIGMFGTLCVVSVVLVIMPNIFGNGWMISAKTEGDRAVTTVLSDEVQEKITELTRYINLYFYDEVDNEKLAEGMYAGLLEGLEDKYTKYYTPQEYADLQISATQNYCGIGAALSQEKESMQVTITHVYDGSPAQAAGLRDGDIVVMVGDIEAVSMELSDLVTYIRGEEDTNVHLQIYRTGETDYLEFDVKRANIDLPTVEHRLLNGNIGYIHIVDFGEPTVKQFEVAVADLKEQGMQGMILDVRDNPGGMITAVTGILDDILPEGTTVYIQDKYGKRQDYTSDSEKQMDYPLAVLMNGNSASASEILAGAIRDYEYGTLIGTTSYGKGVVQSILELDDGDAIKLTTAKYFTPKGENIHGSGIKPDIELEFEYLGDAAEGYDEMQDNQVQKAIEVLNKEILAK